MFPSIANTPFLGNFIGLNVAQAACFLFFWFINIWIVYKGIDSIKTLEAWSAPFLLIIGLVLLIWAWTKVGSMNDILNASYSISSQKNIDFWKIFFPGLTAMVGFWATLSLNIPDFTRYAKSQKDQVMGQLIGLPTTMAFYSFIGIAVTSASVLIYGQAIWDPVALMGKFDSPLVVIISMFGLTIATLSTNIAANVVAPANGFSNMAPKIISFKMGGYITGIIGILIFPWKLIADPEGYIFRWLIAYSALLGSLAGIMICDYYLVRKTAIDVKELFNPNGKYKGWNVAAWIAFLISILPVIPGFLVAVGASAADAFSPFFVNLYSYAWFVTFILSFIIYWVIAKNKSE
jgi:NCS1 family nucleobase:cation symporter-1